MWRVALCDMFSLCLSGAVHKNMVDIPRVWMLKRCLDHPDHFTVRKCIPANCTWCNTYGGILSVTNQCDREVCTWHYVGCFHIHCLAIMKAEYHATAWYETYGRSWLLQLAGLPVDIVRHVHSLMGGLCEPMDIYKKMADRSSESE